MKSSTKTDSKETIICVVDAVLITMFVVAIVLGCVGAIVLFGKFGMILTGVVGFVALGSWYADWCTRP